MSRNQTILFRTSHREGSPLRDVAGSIPPGPEHPDHPDPDSPPFFSYSGRATGLALLEKGESNVGASVSLTFFGGKQRADFQGALGPIGVKEARSATDGRVELRPEALGVTTESASEIEKLSLSLASGEELRAKRLGVSLRSYRGKERGQMTFRVERLGDHFIEGLELGNHKVDLEVDGEFLDALNNRTHKEIRDGLFPGRSFRRAYRKEFFVRSDQSGIGRAVSSWLVPSIEGTFFTSLYSHISTVHPNAAVRNKVIYLHEVGRVILGRVKIKPNRRSVTLLQVDYDPAVRVKEGRLENPGKPGREPVRPILGRSLCSDHSTGGGGPARSYSHLVGFPDFVMASDVEANGQDYR